MERRDVWALRVATWFGCGYAKVAPGTAGALGAIPLHLVLSRLSPLSHAALVAALTAVGTLAANRAAELAGIEDPQTVVIDEVVGTLLSMGLVRRRSIAAQALAFGLFRLLDVTKPGVIHRVQHAKPAGLGIMIDDVLAGLIAGAGARWLSRRR